MKVTAEDVLDQMFELDMIDDLVIEFKHFRIENSDKFVTRALNFIEKNGDELIDEIEELMNEYKYFCNCCHLLVKKGE